MSEITLDELKDAVVRLSEKEFQELVEAREEAWDRQIEVAAKAGKLDKLAEEGLRDYSDDKRVGQTVGVYQHAVENGPLAFCHLDPKGVILHANRQMQDLVGKSTLAGENLEHFFDHNGRAFVIQAIAGAHGRGRAERQMEIVRQNGATIPVLVVLEALTRSNKIIGAYAILTDISAVVAREAKFFDRLILPALKLDLDLKITYANEAAVTLLGTSEIVGRSVYDFFPHTPKMDEQFSKRRAGEGDVYETEIARPDDGKRIPVSVTGIPIMDDDDRCVGALGIIRSLEREKIAEAIHNHLETQHDEVKLVELVAQELNKLVPFDFFGVSQYSRDLEHVSSWIRYTRGEKVEIGRRWWPIPPQLKAQLRQPILVPDYLLYLRENALQNYSKETSVKKFLEQGYKSFLRIPITERKRVIASVTLFSKENAKYSRAHIKQIKGLPVEQAIHMAIYYRNKRKFQFRSNLINEMIKLSTAKELASLLAIKLAEQYEWHHVAIFKVCKPEKKFRLLAEAATEGASSLPENLRERSLRIGILGHVYKSRQPVNIPDVSSDELSKAFVAGWPDIHSELCLPIVWDDKVQWLLNAEDQRVQAFSKDEQQEVSVILGEAALLLQRLTRQYLLESAFQSSSDAVLITDSQKTILDANPAAAKLLGYKSSKRLCGGFKRLFKDAQVARGLLSAERTRGMEVDLVRADGTNVPVLISGVDLSDDISRKVFVAKNLTSRRRLERLEELKKLFQEVALQTHTPLALANCWLERLSRFTADQDTVEFITKILGQLKKLEISYDRLALLTTDFNAALATSRKQPLDIAVEIKRIIEEFPISESRRIDFADPGELPYVNCDPVQISFIFASIISYLIRFSPSKKPIDIRFACLEKTISVIISGLLPPKSGESEAERNVARTRFEMALGEPVIEAFAKNNSAQYERRETDGEDAHFKIDFALTAQASTEQ